MHFPGRGALSALLTQSGNEDAASSQPSNLPFWLYFAAMARDRAIPLLAPLARRVSVRTWWHAAGRPLVAVFWHAVGEASALPHIRHLYAPPTPERWRADLDWLLGHFEPLALDEVCAWARGQRRLRRPACFLSFDDGLRQVHDIAWPELQRRGVPFAVFLNSAFVDNADLFFRYKASLLVAQWQQAPPPAAVQRSLAELLPSSLRGLALPQAFLHIGFRQKEVLDAAAHLMGVDFAAFLQEYRPYLNTAQLDAMARAGVAFGGHSHDHPLFAGLDEDACLWQARQSMHWVKSHLPKQSCYPFAFPFTDDGVPASFFAKAQAERLFDCSFGTAGLRGERVAGHVQRHPAEKWTLPLSAQLPAALAWQTILRLVGRGSIRR